MRSRILYSTSAECAIRQGWSLTRCAPLTALNVHIPRLSPAVSPRWRFARPFEQLRNFFDPEIQNDRPVHWRRTCWRELSRASETRHPGAPCIHKTVGLAEYLPVFGSFQNLFGLWTIMFAVWVSVWRVCLVRRRALQNAGTLTEAAIAFGNESTRKTGARATAEHARKSSRAESPLTAF